MEEWERLARECVRDTITRYTLAGDRYRLDDLSECFTDLGTLEVKGRSHATGRAAIVEMLRGSSDQQRPGDDAFFTRHFVTGPTFLSVTEDKIETASYFQVLTHKGLDHWGRYWDVFVPVGDRWLFEHRTAAVDAWVEGSWYLAGE